MAGSPALAADADLGGITALLVEDDDDSRELLATILSMFGAIVVEARSGSEAFAAFERRQPDVIITDVHMANGTGVELIQRVRALAPDQGGLTPAIAMSGISTIEECLDAGFHYHLAKPFQPRLLVDVVRAFIREEPSGKANWQFGIDEQAIWIRTEGHFTGSDVRAMTTALVPLLQASKDGYRIVSDMRRLGSISASVGMAAQLGMWSVRTKIRSVVLVGGSPLARAVSRGACLVLGIPCFVSETVPSVEHDR